MPEAPEYAAMAFAQPGKANNCTTTSYTPGVEGAVRVNELLPLTPGEIPGRPSYAQLVVPTPALPMPETS